MFTWIQTIDWAILHWIQLHMQCTALNVLMPFVSVLGDLGAIWISFAVILTASKKYRRNGFAMFGAMAAGVLICCLIMKPLFARPRPCWLENVPLLVANPTDYSFPSGHTLIAVIGACMLTDANHRFGWFAIPLALLIGFSRLYLYVHFPSDVLASIILGIIISKASILLLHKAAARNTIDAQSHSNTLS